VRRHRTLATAAATVGLLAVLAGGVGYLLLKQHEREQQEQTALVVNQAVGEATALREQARKLEDQPEKTATLWRDALAAAERAERAAAGGTVDAGTGERTVAFLRELRAEAAEADRDRRMLGHLEKARNRQEEEVEESDHIRQENAIIIWGLAASPAYAGAFREYGIDLEKLPTAEAAERIRKRPIRRQLTAALDNWFALDPEAVGGRLLEVSREADPDPQRAQVRTAIARKDREALKRLAEGERVTDLPPETLNLLAFVLIHQGLRAEAIDLMRRGQRKYQDDFWINDHLGVYLTNTNPPDYGEAARCYAAAIAVRKDSTVAWGNLGFTLALEGHLDEAAAALRESIRLNANFTNSYDTLADVLLQKGEPAEALAVVRAALDRRPDSLLMRTTLGSVLYRQGKREEAIAAYREVLRRNPRWFPARLSLAPVLAEAGQKEEALKLLEEGLRLRRGVAHLDAARGGVLLTLRDPQGAEAAYRKALGSGRASPFHWTGLGRALSLQGKHEEALRASRNAVRMVPGNSSVRTALAAELFSHGALDEAVATAREATELNPANANAWTWLGMALSKQAKYPAAADAFAKAMKLEPEKVSTYRRNLAAMYQRLGDALRGKRKYAEAADAIAEAVKLQPANAGYRVALAVAHYRGRDYQRAESAAREAIKLDPKRFEGYNWLGNALDAQGKLDEAVKQYEQAIARQPDHAVVHDNLANTFFKQGKDAEAEAAYRKAASLDPTLTSSRFYLGILLLKKGKAAEAEAELRRAVELAPKHSAAHARLSTALLMQGKVADAITAARRAVELAPSQARQHFRLGDALLAQGAFAEAVVTFHQAKRLRTPADDELDPLPWDERIRDSIRYLELDATLTAVGGGKLKVTDPTEQAALARFCLQQKNRPLTAVRLYTDAFAADGKLADHLTAGHRFSAARAAALVGAGKGQDAGKSDARERERMRRQALEWLKADLALWTRQLDEGRPQTPALCRQALQDWQRTPDLAGLRDTAALAALPEAEREAWRTFWAEVDALLKRAQTR
jgi:tetratricopeptide (TPR) repeat protein